MEPNNCLTMPGYQLSGCNPKPAIAEEARGQKPEASLQERVTGYLHRENYAKT